MLQVVSTPNAPRALGLYSQAIVANGFIFVSGQIAIDPSSNQFVGGSLQEQTRLVLNNLTQILIAAGSNLNKSVKATIFLQDIKDFAEMNQVYGEFFVEHKPARSTVQVAALPLGARIEIELVALA